MYKIIAKDLCGCFDLKEGEIVKEFDKKKDAIKYVENLCRKYNIKFCHKHEFFYEIDEFTITIRTKVIN